MRFLIKNDAGIQEQYAFSDVGKVKLNFVITQLATARYNIFEQCSKLWDVPLAVAQLVKMLALGFLGIGCEPNIEGSAGSDNPQVFVENDQRFANGIHHCLRKGTSVFNLTELLSEHYRPLQSVRESELARYLTEWR